MSEPHVVQRPHNDAGLTDSAGQFSRRYPVWLCDVWGVVHDGLVASQPACRALCSHRGAGGTVIFVTNAPRPSPAILPQLDELRISRDCFDAMVSSGDVTRHLVSLHEGEAVYHLGPSKDVALLDGLPVRFTELQAADLVLCSGLLDDDTETPEQYTDLLSEIAARGMPMICANPDRVVRKGKRLVPCAGALADIFVELGGEVKMAGKPYAPIYDECLRQAAMVTGSQPSLDRVLAIGDGLPTDVKGAADYGMDILFIVDGIHEKELNGTDTRALLKHVADVAPDASIAGVMTGLK